MALLGCEIGSVPMVHQNLSSAVKPLNQSERDALQNIRKLFQTLSVHHWEGIEVNKYHSDPVKFMRFLSEPPAEVL